MNLSLVKKQQLAQALLEKRRRAAVQGKMDLLTWSMLHRRELKPDVLFDLKSHLYLAEMYELVAKKKVVKKAGQMGASELAVSDALWSADVRQATVLYIFPTETHVSDFSSARIGPAVEVSPYLSSIVVGSGNQGGKRGADRVGLKRVRDRFMYLRGARVGKDGGAAQLKSIDADKIYLDELDEMDPRAPVIAQKRLGHSSLGEIMKISTPSFTGRGIDAAYAKSDQRQWFISCDGCGHWQVMGINHVVQEWDDLGRPMAWHGQKDGRAYCACEKCGRELNRLSKGRWVAKHPERSVVGYHLTKLFSPTADLLEIVHQLQSLDETERRECFNQDLGEAYTPTGGKLSEDDLRECIRDEQRLGLVDGERPVMGVDIGAVHNVIIRGQLNEKGERPLRWAEQVGSFEAIEALIRKYNPKVCVIDEAPERTKARELQAKFRDGLVWLATYADLNDRDPVKWDKKKGRVTIDRTRCLDVTIARFRTHENALPANAEALPSYFDQMMAPTRVQVEDKIRYIEDGPDHYAHAENYATAASLRSQGFLW